MKPAPFGYHRVTTVSDAVEMLTAYEGSARLLAGGQSLAPMLNMRLVRPDALIDINGLRELARIETDGDGTVLGALVRYSTIETDCRVAQRLPLLATVVTHIGDRQVRNRGTVGGSLAQGDPTGEMPLACMVLDATVVLTGPGGRREVSVTQLYEDSYSTVIQPDEVLTHVRFPPSPDHHAFAEMCRRHNDFAVISVACAASRQADGTWSDIRIGLGGVADTPFRATAAEALLSGTSLDDEALRAAGRLAVEQADPPTDVRASADYRRHLVPIYVRRVLTKLRSYPSSSDGKESP